MALFEVALRESVLASAMIAHEESLSSGLRRLRETSFDGVVLDLGLPDSDGLDTFVRVSEAAGDAAIVVVTGRDDARLAEEAVRLGAQDYLLKNESRTGEFGRAVDNAIRRQRLLGELQRARDEQLAAKDRFLTHVSHELRSPLSVVHQFATLLLDGVPDEPSAEQAEMLTVLIRNVGQLKVMIDDLLNVSRVQRGQLTIRTRATAIPVLLVEALASQRPAAEQRNIALSLDAGELPMVVADADRLREVLGNVLENALKFTTDGGQISVAACADDHWVRVTVRDTGCGIRPEDRERIFEQFFQARQSDQIGRNGLGLGLFVSRDLVRRQGGAMWAESASGPGATICFTLPVLTQVDDPETAK